MPVKKKISSDSPEALNVISGPKSKKPTGTKKSTPKLPKVSLSDAPKIDVDEVPTKKLSKEEIEAEKQLKRVEKLASEEKIDTAFADPAHEPTTHLILNKDNKSIPEIPDGSVHLAVTSPPYFNAREYSTWASVDDYIEDMTKSFAEVFRVLKPGRKFCLNISDLPEKGESGVRWIPLGPHLVLAALKAGFELVDRVLWYKTPIKGFQYGSLPYPPSPLICDSMEYIYILRKPNKGKVSYEHVSPLQKEASRLKREIYAEYTKQIWTLRRVRLKGNEAGHIAPFPYDIPERCVRLYSFVGETVLDPFAGSGTTAQAAIRNRRNSVMVEQDKSYIKIMKNKLESTKEDDQLFSLRPFGDYEVKSE
jgi:DNA modification methylase